MKKGMNEFACVLKWENVWMNVGMRWDAMGCDGVRGTTFPGSSRMWPDKEGFGELRSPVVPPAVHYPRWMLSRPPLDAMPKSIRSYMSSSSSLIHQSSSVGGCVVFGLVVCIAFAFVVVWVWFCIMVRVCLCGLVFESDWIQFYQQSAGWKKGTNGCRFSEDVSPNFNAIWKNWKLIRVQ